MSLFEARRAWFVRAMAMLALIALTPLPGHAQTLIQRTITIDGAFTDWTQSTNILTNTGQFSTDLVGTGDRDAPVQSSGRDLAKFAYTWDSTNPYLYVERAGSVSNVTDWWFYIDTNADGKMQSGEKVLRVNWSGSTRSTGREICNYVQSATGGDPVVSASTGKADGYDMPGTITGCTTISPAQSGGGSTGLQMETSLSWTSRGFTGPSAVGFHISSSNGANIPAQLDDNMDGPGGSNFLFFADHSIEKTTSASTVASGVNYTYSLKLSNLSSATSSNIVVTDVLPAGITYVSHTPPAGTTATYTAATRTLSWSIPTIAATSSLTLTITVTAGPVSANTTVANTANITSLDQNSANNTSSVSVDIVAASFTLLKTVLLISDPVNGTSNPRSIPGAISEYTITATNFGGLSDAGSVKIVDPIPTNTKMYVADLGRLHSSMARQPAA